MSDDDPEARDPSTPVPPTQPAVPALPAMPEKPAQPETPAQPGTPALPGDSARGPEGDTPAHVRDRLRTIAARLREAAEDLGGEVMIEIPSRLGDHEGLLLALANELEQLVK
ncbi:MAG TPA: hypothetical protein VJA16_13855 [Thermoanaerobaculia bacterium]